MKSTNEMVRDVFKRRDEYEAAKSKHKKYITFSLISAACVCLCAACGYQFAKGFMSTDAPDEPQSENTIVLNEIDGAAFGGENRLVSDIALMCDHFVPMSQEEICEYYGANIFPEVPADLPLQSEVTGLGIFRREDGVVYYDSNFLDYSNEDFSRYIFLAAGKCRGDFFFCVAVPEPDSYSVIKGKQIAIGQYDDHYVAEFALGETHFRIVSKGLSLEEFISVIESLL